MSQESSAVATVSTAPSMSRLIDCLAQEQQLLNFSAAAYGTLKRAVEDPEKAGVPILSWLARVGDRQVEVHTDLNQLDADSRMMVIAPMLNSHAADMHRAVSNINQLSHQLLEMFAQARNPSVSAPAPVRGPDYSNGVPPVV